MSSRRTGKTGATGSSQSAQAGGQHVQQQLQNQADEMGKLLADNFQAQALMTMIQSMESGTYGPKTAAILEALSGGINAPLEMWSHQIQSWHEPPMLAAAESDG